jgi:tetratricopeptide (TPR) repeat protein
MRGDLLSDTSLKAKAYKAYDLATYADAITLFEQVQQKDEGVYLYLGNAYLALGDATKAIPLFEKVIAEYDVFDEPAEWYLALAYLRNNRVEEAVSKLRALQQGNNSYADEAERLLKKL